MDCDMNVTARISVSLYKYLYNDLRWPRGTAICVVNAAAGRKRRVRLQTDYLSTQVIFSLSSISVIILRR